MKSIYNISIVIVFSLFVFSCKNEQEPLSPENLAFGTPIEEFTITGSIEHPTMVEVDKNGYTRSLVLRENSSKYPKIVFTDLANGGKEFEQYFSSVWVYDKSTSMRIFVEDNGVNNAHKGDYPLGNDNASAISTEVSSKGATKGVSRVLKYGDKYKVFIRFSSNNYNNPNQKYNSWYPTYNNPATNYNVQVALNPLTNGAKSWPLPSAHRVYAPILFKSDSYGGTDPRVQDVQLPPLKLVKGDYHVGGESNQVVIGNQTKPADDKMFVIPLISDYNNTLNLNGNTKATSEVKFRMRGILLSMNLQNKTGKKIILKKLKTKSNNLAYIGFYEIWHSANANAANVRNQTPLFIRAVNGGEDPFRNHIYEFNLKNTDDQNYIPINPNADSDGRIYLWGGLDSSRDPSTKVQFVFSYEDAPNVDLLSQPMELTPKTAPNRFEEGKVYLINVPINRPIQSGTFGFNDFDKSLDDWN